MYPDLDATSVYIPPRHSHDIGEGFVILRPRERSLYTVYGLDISGMLDGLHKVTRWGRLRLANGQIARCLWGESKKKAPRISRNIKVCLVPKTINISSFYIIQLDINGVVEFGEAQFFFLHGTGSEISQAVAYAVVSIYSRPNQAILDESFQTLWVCAYKGESNLHLVSAKSIISVVSMQPLPSLPEEPAGEWFVVEKSGLDDADLTGQVEKE